MYFFLLISPNSKKFFAVLGRKFTVLENPVENPKLHVFIDAEWSSCNEFLPFQVFVYGSRTRARTYIFFNKKYKEFLTSCGYSSELVKLKKT